MYLAFSLLYFSSILSEDLFDDLVVGVPGPDPVGVSMEYTQCYAIEGCVNNVGSHQHNYYKIVGNECHLLCYLKNFKDRKNQDSLALH